MKYILLIFATFILSTLISCEGDLDIPIPIEESKIVVNSLLGTDSLIRVHVSNSNIINQENVNIVNAQIFIKENNVELGQMKNVDDGWYTLDNSYLKSNSSYQIDILHPNFDNCQAVTKTLEVVPIAKIEYNRKDENQLDFSIEFQDDSSVENYYMILLKGKQNSAFTDIEYNSDDIIFNGNLSENTIGLQQNILRGSRTFSDENRNGNKLKVSFYVYSEFSDISQLFDEYEIILYNITQDYFKYERSLVTFNNREDLPFYNKVNLHSNVTNGYGIFTSYAADSKSIIIE